MSDELIKATAVESSLRFNEGGEIILKITDAGVVTGRNWQGEMVEIALSARAIAKMKGNLDRDGTCAWVAALVADIALRQGAR